MDTMFNKGDDGKKPVRHINLGTKNTIVRMKELHEALCHIMMGSKSVVKAAKSEIDIQTSPLNARQPRKEAKRGDPGQTKPTSQISTQTSNSESSQGCQEVGPKRKTRVKEAKPRRAKPDALLIQPISGVSYSDVLALVTRRADEKLDHVRSHISSFKITVPNEYFSAMVDPNFWTEGPVVHKFASNKRSLRPLSSGDRRRYSGYPSLLVTVSAVNFRGYRLEHYPSTMQGDWGLMAPHGP
ncbi:uncharacterized protein Dwil_GK18785 [Drosophila willistoni]|uniref:Uncharacterized protein n=1 Tax=Drosophila willistoni TaxID=7260 RepID=B4N7E2_DROWI|nr:uncharacterized protein Dwil_GK18785 [Drosophila willistoni]